VPFVADRLLSYSRFVKLEHTLFSLPLLFSGAVLAAHGWPSGSVCGLIFIAGLGARAAAFALNRIIDRHIDQRNPRTANRELPRGTLTLTEAWGVCWAGSALYLLSAWALAPICLILSPIPLAIFCVYPYLKRYTSLAHFGVGLADAMAPLGGWMAVTRSFHPVWPGLLLGLFTFFWVSGFDVIYAMMDQDFDRTEGLYSLPARWGEAKALAISAALHGAAFASLAALYWNFLRFPVGLAMLLIIGGMLCWEHLQSHNVELAFFRINAVLGFLVLGFVCTGFLG
jgi:4-hydroxybenzoate polyprenyltransferase